MNLPNGIKVITSEYCFEDSDEHEDKEVLVKRGGFWERIFDTDPTLHIWDDYKTKTIRVKKKKPIMYMLNGDKLIIHPSFLEELKSSIFNLSYSYEGMTTATAETDFSMENYKEALAKLENFK